MLEFEASGNDSEAGARASAVGRVICSSVIVTVLSSRKGERTNYESTLPKYHFDVSRRINKINIFSILPEVTIIHQMPCTVNDVFPWFHDYKCSRLQSATHGHIGASQWRSIYSNTPTLPLPSFSI